MQRPTWLLPLLAATMISSAGLSAVAQPKPEERRQDTPAEVFQAMVAGFRPEKARAVQARYQFLISGPNGGAWWITVFDGSYQIGRGRIDAPDVTLSTSDDDWVRLADGSLGGTWAVLTGRLHVDGNVAAARKLDEIFP